MAINNIGAAEIFSSSQPRATDPLIRTQCDLFPEGKVRRLLYFPKGKVRRSLLFSNIKMTGTFLRVTSPSPQNRLHLFSPNILHCATLPKKLLTKLYFLTSPCLLKREFLGFFLFYVRIQHGFICRPSDSTVSAGAGIEPWTVATLALTAPGLRIRIHFIRIRIQHFRLNTDPDPGL